MPPNADSVARYPKVGSAAIIREGSDHCLVLGQRGKQPNAGKWVMPGGKVEWGETIDQAVVREVREETGLIVRVVERLGIFEIVDPNEHSVFVLSEVVVEGGDFKAGDDLIVVRWVFREELPKIDLSSPCRAALETVGWLSHNGRSETP